MERDEKQKDIDTRRRAHDSIQGVAGLGGSLLLFEINKTVSLALAGAAIANEHDVLKVAELRELVVEIAILGVA